ncbi:hypothetical protein CL634_08415, partial [bacterium]|nr:hypothetical protein [bacterium]
KIAKIKPNGRDDWNAILTNLIYIMMELSDEDWLKLSNEAQQYINDCVQALQEKTVLPKLELSKIFLNIPPKDNVEHKFGGLTHSRKAKIPKNWIITVLAERNPKRKGKRSWRQFRLYRDGISIQEYIKIGGSRAGVNYDLEHGFIKVQPPEK